MSGATGERRDERVPDRPVRVQRDGRWQETTTAALFGGRRLVVFALPGAFTPTCSSQHLPRYEELAPVLRRHGVDAVLCVAVNDPFVMEAWGRNQGLREIELVADGNGEFTEAMGMLLDARGKGLGRRSRRYSMLVDDGRIECLFAERDGDDDPYEVSDADTMLDHLAPDAVRPPRIAVFAKPGEVIDRRLPMLYRPQSRAEIQLPESPFHEEPIHFLILHVQDYCSWFSQGCPDCRDPPRQCQLPLLAPIVESAKAL